MAEANPPRVSSKFFGANFSPNEGMGLVESQRHFEQMVANGVRQVKVDVSWREFEPFAPRRGERNYQWQTTDRLMTALAEAGVKPNVTIHGTPRWAASNDLFEQLECRNSGIRTPRPVDINSYIAAAGAVAKRYGRGGTFWEGKARTAPISRYFIWNEANSFPNWCPRPDPAAYAYMLGGSALAIKAHDPQAFVLNGGLPDIRPHRRPRYQQPGDFLYAMIQSRPDLLAEIDAIGINMFWFSPTEAPLDRVTWFREELRRAGVPDSEPMLIAEVGWPTKGRLGLTEKERTARMRRYTKAIPRTNCNVPAVMVHTWISSQLDSNDSEDWFGLADPLTAGLYPAGERYARSIALFRGKTRKKAPSAAILNCSKMPPPDRDGDGIPDEQDSRPLNPSRS